MWLNLTRLIYLNLVHLSKWPANININDMRQKSGLLICFEVTRIRVNENFEVMNSTVEVYVLIYLVFIGPPFVLEQLTIWVIYKSSADKRCPVNNMTIIWPVRIIYLDLSFMYSK